MAAVPSVFGGFIQLLQVDKTRAKFLFTLIIFFVLLIFIGIAPHCGHCCKGCSLSLVTTNIQQLFSDRVLRGEAILEISLEERLIANPASQKILSMFLVELRQRLRQEWYDNLTDVRELAVNTAERHFHVMHHMMRKASTIWATTTGIDRNPADQVEVEHIDDTRKRYLSEEELLRLKVALDERMYRKGTKDINKTNLRLRLLVLIAVSTGMRRGEVFRLEWKDILYGEGLIAVRARLKKGKIRLVPMPPELAAEIRRYPSVIGVKRILPPEPGAKSGRQRADKSFHELLERAKIRDFRFHDLRHTFASWYMMSGGDLYELSKLLGHSNIKMTERYADLARAHIVKTGNVSRELWSKLEPQSEREESEVAQKKIGRSA